MTQTLEARLGERLLPPTQIEQFEAAKQLLQNMGYFFGPISKGTHGKRILLSTSQIDLITSEQWSKRSYTPLFDESPVKFALRFKATGPSYQPFEYTVVGVEDKETRSSSLGSVFRDGRQVLQILQGYINPAMRSGLVFNQDKTTNFVRLKLPEKSYDSRAVALGRNIVIGLEFQPQVPTHRDIPSTQHGRVVLIPLPASPRTT